MPGLRVSCFAIVLLLTISAIAQDGSSSSDKSKVKPVNETVVVTGTFTPTPQNEIDRAVTVVETDSRPGLYNNWVDLLELVPSVDLRQRGPNNIQGDLSIRGSGFGETLVLLDGFRRSGYPKMEVIQAGQQAPQFAPNDPMVLAVTSVAPVKAAVPGLALDDIGALADFVVGHAVEANAKASG